MQTAMVPRGSGPLLVISDDPEIVGARESGPALVWNGEALDGPRSNCAWDLVGSVDSPGASDRIAESLLSTVLDNRLAAFFAPEACLLVANMLLATCRVHGTFADVLDWVCREDLSRATQILADTGEDDAYQDMLAFEEQPTTTQGSVWETTQMALQPLNYGPLLAAITPEPQAISVSAPFASMIRTARETPPVPTLYLLRSASSPYRGLSAALCGELLRTASHSSTVTTVIHCDTYGTADDQ
jgi:hypothetical protein